MLKVSRPVCSRCNNSFATRQSLWNHKQRCRGLTAERKVVFNDNDDSSIDITASKICKKNAREKQPHCDEIIHFDSDEFQDGEPKSLETLKKLTQLVNKEVPAKKIGMGTAAIPPPPIGEVDASVLGVPGKQQQQPSHSEIQKILKPIAPPFISSLVKEAPRRSTNKNVNDNSEETSS